MQALRCAFSIVRDAPNDVNAVTGYLSIHLAHVYEGHVEPVFREPDQVELGSWVELSSASGTKVDFIIGRDNNVPGASVFHPDHPLAAGALGQRVGQSFEQVRPFGLVEHW